MKTVPWASTVLAWRARTAAKSVIAEESQPHPQASTREGVQLQDHTHEVEEEHIAAAAARANRIRKRAAQDVTGHQPAPQLAATHHSHLIKDNVYEHQKKQNAKMYNTLHLRTNDRVRHAVRSGRAVDQERVHSGRWGSSNPETLANTQP